MQSKWKVWLTESQIDIMVLIEEQSSGYMWPAYSRLEAQISRI